MDLRKPILFWLMVLGLAPGQSFAGAEAVASPRPGDLAPSSTTVPTEPSGGSVRVVVDPRIELMGIVQLLNGYFLTTEYDFVYKLDALSHFSSFRDHPAVTMFSEMSQSGFNFDAVPKAMLALTAPPELNRRVDLPDRMIERAGGEERFGEFVEALRNFAIDSRFQPFLEAHQGTFENVIEATTPAVEGAVEALRRYTGMDLDGTSVVLGMLLHHGGFAASMETSQGEVEAWALIGPVGSQDGLPTFGSATYVASTAWHEFSHTFINPLSHNYESQIAAYASLLEPIAEQMAQQAYPDWQTTVNEHVIRAITTRLIQLEQGDDAGREALARETKRGFVYVEALVDRLKEYEASRDRYPNIASFYPRLIDVFREASEAER